MIVDRPRYIYVVVGLNDNNANFEGCFLVVSEKHAGHSTKEKAQKELQAIYEEAVNELANEGEVLTNWEMDEDSLSMDFPSGSHEYYRIYKILVN